MKTSGYDNDSLQLPKPNPLQLDLRSRIGRATRAAAALARGEGILVADDGSRENEVDFVFHAAAATAGLVNTALAHCKGLLCVSLSPERADSLGFLTAPRTPGTAALTGFTISVDAREGISSGISAEDRAKTISLMGLEGTKPADFITPGHVFPVRAVEGGLCQRTGHTEAVLELCRLAQMIEAAAMCECLGPDGRALTVAEVAAAEPGTPFHGVTFVSTVDLLWHRLLMGPLLQTQIAESQWSSLNPQPVSPSAVGFEWTPIQPSHDPAIEGLLLPYSVWLRSGVRLRDVSVVSLQWAGRIEPTPPIVHAQDADAVVSVFDPTGPVELPDSLAGFCDLSAKEGLRASSPAARRLLTELLLLEVFEGLEVDALCAPQDCDLLRLIVALRRSSSL
jgi:3,4-dihydroxy-2-butanone 4-phosphate synthase